MKPNGNRFRLLNELMINSIPSGQFMVNIENRIEYSCAHLFRMVELGENMFLISACLIEAAIS